MEVLNSRMAVAHAHGDDPAEHVQVPLSGVVEKPLHSTVVDENGLLVIRLYTWHHMLCFDLQHIVIIWTLENSYAFRVLQGWLWDAKWRKIVLGKTKECIDRPGAAAVFGNHMPKTSGNSVHLFLVLDDGRGFPAGPS